jgi:hypothetical protein
VAAWLPLTNAVALVRPLFMDQWPADWWLHAGVLARWWRGAGGSGVCGGGVLDPMRAGADALFRLVGQRLYTECSVPELIALTQQIQTLRDRIKKAA